MGNKYQSFDLSGVPLIGKPQTGIAKINYKLITYTIQPPAGLL